jgi:hypothetical protein
MGSVPEMRVDTRKQFEQVDANAVRGRTSTWRTRVADVTLATGQPLAVHNWVIVHLTDGQITPIGAYVDPTFETQLGFVRGAAEWRDGILRMIQARQREVAFRQGIPLRLSEGREPGNATRFPGSTLCDVLSECPPDLSTIDSHA